MSSFLSLSQFISSTSYHYVMTVLHKVKDHILKIQHLRTTFYKCNIIYAETGLKGSMLIKCIQNYIGNCITFKDINDPHPVPVTLIPYHRNAGNLFVINKIGSLFDHICLVNLIWDLCYSDTLLAGYFFQRRFCTYHDPSATCFKSFPYSVITINSSAGWEI